MVVDCIRRDLSSAPQAAISKHPRLTNRPLLVQLRGAQNFDDVKTLFMQSDGGLTPVSSFRGSRAVLSGPAGGVVGYAATSYGGADGVGKEKTSAVIGFDMGGTSTGEVGDMMSRS